MSFIQLLFVVLLVCNQTILSSSDGLKDNELCVLKVDSHGKIKLVNKDVVYYGLLVGAMKDLTSLQEKSASKRKPQSKSIGSTPSKPAKSCLEIKGIKPNSPSAVYWIQPIRGSKPIQVHCDMETADGGWTLVWNYRFTSYDKFKSKINAVTPRPSWPTPEANVGVSTTIPLHEGHFGAMDFNLWKEIGNEFLIKSHLNHWVACEPYKTHTLTFQANDQSYFEAGSLVHWLPGNVMCRVVKNANVMHKCWNRKPHFLRTGNKGPKLESKRECFITSMVARNLIGQSTIPADKGREVILSGTLQNKGEHVYKIEVFF